MTIINKYAEDCAGCHTTVKAGHGERRQYYGKWETYHLHCKKTVDARRKPAIVERGPHYFDEQGFDDSGGTNYDWRTYLNPDEGDYG